MPHSSLATYLNDHLAGSVVAIRMLESLEAAYAESERTRDIGWMVAQVRREIEADRDVLERLVQRVGTGESTMRKTAGWFAERFAQAKLAADDSDDGTFRLLEMSEVVVLGIVGKSGLWRALKSCADLLPTAHGLDFDALVARSNSQYERMEAVRLGAARVALGG